MLKADAEADKLADKMSTANLSQGAQKGMTLEIMTCKSQTNDLSLFQNKRLVRKLVWAKQYYERGEERTQNTYPKILTKETVTSSKRRPRSHETSIPNGQILSITFVLRTIRELINVKVRIMLRENFSLHNSLQTGGIKAFKTYKIERLMASMLRNGIKCRKYEIKESLTLLKTDYWSFPGIKSRTNKEYG
jgi:hypothetical protein